MPDLPLITIITCTRNSGRFLQDCLISVNSQTYRNFEHIFIDTNSKDETEKIIKNYQHFNKRLISFPTEGIYQAFNEGLRQAKGRIIGFLHSDDTFSDSECLERIAMAFTSKPNLGFYCSKMNIYDQYFKENFASLGAPPHTETFKESLYSLFYYAHPTYYCDATIISQVGFYNEKYYYAADSDWLQRLEFLKVSFTFDKKTLINFRSNGSTARHYLITYWEEARIKLENNKLSLDLIFILSWHLIRRLIKFIFEFTHLKFLISISRKYINIFLIRS
jgi:glycosyltransferase involved in cell wall biosynthesis